MKSRRTHEFLSHSCENDQLAAKVKQGLEPDLGVELACEKKEPGRDLCLKFKSGIRHPGHFLLLWDQHCQGSDRVHMELAWAEQYHKEIIPLLVGKVELPISLQGKEYLRIDPDLPEEAIRVLKEYLLGQRTRRIKANHVLLMVLIIAFGLSALLLPQNLTVLPIFVGDLVMMCLNRIFKD